LLDPKEIDTYFNANALNKKISFPPINHHTRKVMLAKIILPIIAGALILILMILPNIKENIKDFGLEFNIGKGEFEHLNIKNTTVYITDEKNRVNNFVAKQVQETQNGSKIYNLIAPTGIMPLDEHEWLNISSPDGLFDQNISILTLTNTVEIFYSKGLNISTKEASFDFKSSYGYSKHPVTGDGFIGKLEAQGFEYDGKNNILSFTGKTHILINQDSLK
jgi:lipopolysaccharide export system protein LptC